MNLNEFLNMGGYAFFVWTAYGAFALVLLWSFLSPMLKRRSLVRDLRASWAVEARRRQTP